MNILVNLNDECHKAFIDPTIIKKMKSKIKKTSKIKKK